jgi:hypothetical protein
MQNQMIVSYLFQKFEQHSFLVTHEKEYELSLKIAGELLTEARTDLLKVRVLLRIRSIRIFSWPCPCVSILRASKSINKLATSIKHRPIALRLLTSAIPLFVTLQKSNRH